MTDPEPTEILSTSNDLEPLEKGSQTVVDLSPRETEILEQACTKSLSAFKSSPSATPVDFAAKWDTLAGVFAAVLRAPIKTAPLSEPDAKPAAWISRGHPPHSPQWIVRFLIAGSSGLPGIVLMEAHENQNLARVHHFQGLESLSVTRSPQGWDVVATGSQPPAHFRIDEQGIVRDLGAENDSDALDLSPRDYQARRDPELHNELEAFRKQKITSLDTPAAEVSVARELEEAFDSLDLAEKKRQEHLHQRLQSLEKKARQRQVQEKEKKPEPFASAEQAVETPLPADTPAPLKCCNHCGDPLIEGKPFCASCGRPVLEEPEPPPAQAESAPPETCRHCGAVLIAGRTFCPDCGSPRSAPIDQDSAAVPAPGGRARAVQPEPQVPEPAAVSAGAVCSHCQKPLKPGARFCAGCGSPLSESAADASPKPPEPESPSDCPACGRKLKPGARFCTHCGHSVSPGAKPGPAAPFETTPAERGKEKRKRPAPRKTGPGVMHTAMAFAPGLGLDAARHWSLYQYDPQMILPVLLPSLLSLVSVGLAPKIGRWAAILMVLLSLAWLVHPFFLGAPLEQFAGRGLLGGSFVYTIVRLLRMAKPR